MRKLLEARKMERKNLRLGGRKKWRRKPKRNRRKNSKLKKKRKRLRINNMQKFECLNTLNVKTFFTMIS